MRALVLALVNRLQRRAFNTWLYQGHAVRAAWRLLRRSASVMLHLALGRAYHHWARHFEWPKAASKLVLAFGSAMLARAVVRWRLGAWWNAGACTCSA